ncbi:diaminopimelate decarboxylase [Marinisporobacter balticus]|uniref:Diaminopimelate decarboxylase n=1 Tax=Marinisporobacter balticus TaxID=2018667 RepID=A0A4R2K5D8_9FIRM|nr:diaminopimelate decarboxylase [Marinisporobacter balticus]TCO67734.1 diaminopimelate decarboxylase [Marinisporobacter balticus]
MNAINKMTNHFYFGGCDTIELAKKYGTPLYVMNEEHINERCQEIRDDFLNKYENTKAVYASKAFLTMKMCKIIEREGLGIDVVSGGELYTAIKADFPMEKIIFHGNNKTLDEIEIAVKNNVGRIVVDNLYELELLNSVAQAFGKNVEILFRITPGVDSHTHKYISTGQVDSKFGIPLKGDIINEAVKKAMDLSNIMLMGFHFHVGSQLFDHSSHIKAVKILVKLMDDMKKKTGFVTRELNTGGGFGIYYKKGDEPKPLTYFTDAIMETIIDECKTYGLLIPLVIIEPGRWIVGEAGITLYTVGAIKEIPDVRTYVGVDGGIPDNPRPALYGAKYDVVVANKMDQEKDEVVTIAGKCCESGDILRYDLEVPKLHSGDILAFKSTGAYNYSMSSNYNKIPRPAVVMVCNGEDQLMVRRETYEDLLKNEL